MKSVITRGDQTIEWHYRDDELREMTTGLLVILLGQDKFISSKSAQEKLEIITETLSEFTADEQNPTKKKE